MIAALDREIRACVEAHTERSFYQPLRRRIIGRNAELRVRLTVAQISGLMLALTPATDQIIGTTAVDELIDVYRRRSLTDEPAVVSVVSRPRRAVLRIWS